MKTIDHNLLDRLSAQAKGSPRLRRNLNLHASYDEPCQRLLNALEPGTYVRPHRHLAKPKPECFIGVRGRMALILFDEQGGITRTLLFGPDEAAVGADLPAGVWHSVVCLAEGSVFFETKPGPYVPMTDKDLAPWAPAEGSAEAAAYLARLMAAVGDYEPGR
jgi:cupin fold WbuC family metalloprotein